MSKIKVLGQDPSMNNWGLAMAEIDIENYEIDIIELKVIQEIKQSKDTKKTVRKNSLDLQKAIRLNKELLSFTLKHNPSMTMIEVPHGSQSASAMKGYGICIGLISTFHTVPLIQLQEAECKINAVGKRIATKREMIDWAMSEHPNANWKMRKSKGELVSVDGYNEHAADAIGALHAGILTDQFRGMVEMMQRVKSLAM